MLKRLTTLYLALLLPQAPAHAQTPDAELAALLQQTVQQSDSFIDQFDAQVWLVDMSGRLERWVSNPEERLTLLKLAHGEAVRAELDPQLVLALIHVESHFDRFAVSRVGAQGLMQVMPFWKGLIGRPDDNLTHLATNLRYGCTILKHYLDKEKGNLTRALARYNGSLGKTWYPERVFDAWQNHWFVRNQETPLHLSLNP